MGGVEALVSARRALRLYAHGQVDEGEDVVLDHDGDAEEDGVQDQDVNAQLEVQPPFVQVDAQNLRAHKRESGSSFKQTVLHNVGVKVCKSKPPKVPVIY